jgi:hypothetical protein
MPTELDAAVGARLATKVHLLLKGGAKPTEATYDTAIRTQQIATNIFSRIKDIVPLAMVTELVKSGVAPTTANLDLAVDCGQPRIVQRLIEAGAKPTEATYAIAIRHSRPEMIPNLARSGVAPTAANLHMAVQTKMRDTVKALIRVGAIPNEETYDLAATYNELFDHNIFFDLQNSGVALTEQTRTAASKNFWIQATQDRVKKEPSEELPWNFIPTEEDLKQAILDAGKIHNEMQEKERLKQKIPTEDYESARRAKDRIERLIDAGAKPDEGTYNIAIGAKSGHTTMSALLASGVAPTTANLNFALKSECAYAGEFVVLGTFPSEESYDLTIQFPGSRALEAIIASGAPPTTNNLKQAVLKSFMTAEYLIRAGVEPTEEIYNLAMDPKNRAHGISMLQTLLASKVPPTVNNLNYAFEVGAVSYVLAILGAGVKPTSDTYNLAMDKGHFLDRLLASGVVPSTENLNRAITKDPRHVASLVQAGAKPSEETYHLAIDADARIVGALAASGVAPTANNLEHALKKNPHAVGPLMRAGAEVKQPFYDLAMDAHSMPLLTTLARSKVVPSETQLRRAMGMKDPAFAQYLISAGARPTEAIYNLAMDPSTPSRGLRMLQAVFSPEVPPTLNNLHYAMEQEDDECVAAIIAAGMNPTSATYDLAISKGKVSDSLLASGVAPSKRHLEMAEINPAVSHAQFRALEAAYEASLPIPDSQEDNVIGKAPTRRRSSFKI